MESDQIRDHQGGMKLHCTLVTLPDTTQDLAVSKEQIYL